MVAWVSAAVLQWRGVLALDGWAKDFDMVMNALHGLQGAHLLFIHGAGSSADFWHWQRSAFPQGQYLDLPGHGRGATMDPAWQNGDTRTLIARYAAWVADYVEGEHLADVVLNGHSMGGAITLTLALERPAWLRAIVLTGTGARLRVSPHLLHLLRTDYAAAIDAIIESSFAPATIPLSYAQKVRRNGTRRQMLRTPREVTLADYEACDNFDVMKCVGEIRLPTLCVVGDRDAMTPVKYSDHLHRSIHGSLLEVVKEAGHMLPLEKPDEYNRHIGHFVGMLTTQEK
jgi:pimeloyl-ACP methyl ester carboxylesterase